MNIDRRLPLVRRAVPEIVTALAILVVFGSLPAERVVFDHPGSSTPAGAAPAHGNDDHVGVALGAPGADGARIHALPTHWTDHRGRSGTLADLAPGIRITAMIYTDCSMACPIIVGDMKRIEAALDARGLAEPVGFTLVSFDTVRDTPERLARFATDARLTPGRWTLLHGDETQVRTLSVLLGVSWDRADDGSIGHANRITLLDGEGRIAAVADGLGVDVAPLVEAAARLANAETGR